MMPPPAGRGSRLTYEPLSRWERVDSFATKEGCEQMRAKLIKRMPASAIDTSRCVSSDDPNLPKKPREPKEHPLVG